MIKSKTPSLFVANWKMNGDLKALEKWADDFSHPANCVVVLCPPFPYISEARRILPEQISIGAQCVSYHMKDGAHTGEVSARMLREMGCDYVIVGHSERRVAGDTDEYCSAQLSAAVSYGLVPILCIGEDKKEYNEGKANEVINRQLKSLDAISSSSPTEYIVAYEPVWAIGTSKTPSADELSRIREKIQIQISQTNGNMDKISILYGGSITMNNACLITDAGMDGGLVGAASLDGGKFARICRCGDV